MDVAPTSARSVFEGADQPYPGLRSFSRDEAHIFFGREGTINAMVDRLAAHRFLAVTGASGSGKSSLVRTGLLDALDRGLLAAAGSDWIVVDFRPGNEPLAALAAALTRALELDGDMRAIIDARLAQGRSALPAMLDDLQVPGQSSVLLLVDQFEETFRYRQNDEADAFVALLLASVAQRRRNIYGVLTMRSDFLGECTRFPGLAEAINDSQFLAPRLTRAQLRSAITGPAAVYGGTVEPALVTQLLNDVGNNPDQLPLMQHVLMLMWQEACEAGQGEAIALTARRYGELGGIVPTRQEAGRGALSAHLDQLLGQLAPAQQRLAEVLFRCLVDSEGAVSRDVRRPTPLGEVAAVAGVAPAALVPVIEEFRAPGRNFLTPAPPTPLTPESVIDISHESLIRQWHTMRSWARKELASATEYRRIDATAELWNRGREGLLRRPYLGVVKEWLAQQRPTQAWAGRYGGDFALATRFIEQSIRRSRQRVLAGIAGLVLLFGSLCAFSVVQYDRAVSTRSELEAVRGEMDRQQQTLDERLQRSFDRMADDTRNLADETTDYGVLPQDVLQVNIATATPLSIPGGHVLFLRDFARLYRAGQRPLLIDAWNGTGTDHAKTIPTASRIPYAGSSGSFDDDVQRRLATRLDNLTDGDKGVPLIFFCVSSSCWESYNAALRAIHAGHTAVYWFRGGNLAWTAGDNEWQSIIDEVRLTELRIGQQAGTLRQRWADAVALAEIRPIIATIAADTVEARRVVERAVEAMSRLSDELGSNRAFQSDLADAQAGVGWAEMSLKHIPAALAAFGKEATTRQTMAEAEPSDFASRQEWITSLLRVAYFQQENQLHEEAKTTAEAVKSASAAPSDDLLATVYGRVDKGRWHREIGLRLAQLGLRLDALSFYRKAQELDEGLLQQASMEQKDRVAQDLWQDYRAEAELLVDAKLPANALQLYHRSAEQFERLVGDQPGWPGSSLAAASARKACADILQKQYQELVASGEQLELALKDAQHALDAGSPSAGSLIKGIAGSMGTLAWNLELAASWGRALELADRALAVAPDLEWVGMNRAHALMFLDRADEARAIYVASMGKTLNGKVWNDDLRSDFRDLRSRGHPAPLMGEIERMLPPPKP